MHTKHAKDTYQLLASEIRETVEVMDAMREEWLGKVKKGIARRYFDACKTELVSLTNSSTVC